MTWLLNLNGGSTTWDIIEEFCAWFKTLIYRFLRSYRLHLCVHFMSNPSSWSGKFMSHVACIKVLETLAEAHDLVAPLILTCHLTWDSWLIHRFDLDLAKAPIHSLLGMLSSTLHSWLHGFMVSVVCQYSYIDLSCH